MGLSQSISKRCADPSKYATVDAPGLAKDDTKWKTYDFVIVGGGAAGCVLAARLSENSNVSVLLLEAGNSHEGNLISSMPFTGKILGGTSFIQDFNSWAKKGAEGWSYEELRPQVQTSFVFRGHMGLRYVPNPIMPDGKEEEHGTSGPIKTRKPVPKQDIDRLMIETARNIGITARSDLNTNGTLGAAAFLATITDKGRRGYAAVSYLTPEVLKRPNLTVAVNCRVEKLLFDETGPKPRAIGVEFRRTREGPLYRVAGKKEILVCGGAVASPHILLLSGLGPRSELEKKGIKVIKHLPAVGKNFMDHISAGTFNLQAKPGTTYDYLNNPLYALLAVAQWFFTGTGVVSELAAPGAIFVRSTDDPCIPTNDPAEIPIDLTTGPNAPDLEILWFPLTVVANAMTKTSSKVKGVTLSPVALQPKSVGEITLATNSAWDQPIIDANFLDEENDMKVIVRGCRLIYKLAHTEPFASMLELNPKPDYPFFWPGCADPDKITDGELSEWVRKNASPTFHPGCSCKMGTSEDSSVVNNKLEVHGIESLRIIDASIFPNLVSGHPCAPVVAVAEKASDMIKQRYGF
ncbi:hypothetical protein Clacol_004520 [Clathrus columnatus]|uniref:Glucose-methanol-choline oxidoreductase N-terminal domain-containing protein n=1 Tax=Clathrus columnatus TaxID=1419009 RepID=A0AAV5AAN9_9AGAM|nr:hypothetical protein Clacol_004520 [Clathrus columnatus]